MEGFEISRKDPVQKRAQGTVSAILEAFTHIFSRQGPKEANTNRVALKAGVSIGSLYQYFPNKQAILVAVIRKHSKERLERLTQIKDSIQGKTLEQVVAEMVDVVIDLRARDRGFETVLIENLSHYRVLETIREQQSGFVGLLSECLELLDHPGTAESRKEAAGFLYHTAFSLTVWMSYFEDGTMTLDQLKSNVRRLFVGYLRI